MMSNRWSMLLLVWTIILGLWTPLAQAEPLDDYNSALKFYEQKRWEFAATGFQEFLDKAPTHAKAPLAQLYLGQSLTHSQKYDAARAVFRKFLIAHPQHTDAPLAAYRIGESSYFLSDFKAASTELESFVKTYPNHELAVWGWQYLGETRLQLKDATGAVQAFEVVLKLKTDVAEQIEAKFYLARAYESLQQGEKAAALYKEVSAANHPRAADALVGTAETEYQAGRFESAAKHFEELTTRFPKHTLVPTAELNAGFSRYQLHDYVGAESHFDRATQTPAQALTAMFWKGMCRKSRSDWAGAIEVFTALAAKMPPNELAEKLTYHWADSALQGKHVAEAIRLAEEFPTRFSKSELLPQNALLLGRALLARGDQTPAAELAPAQADFQKAAQLFRNVIAVKTPPRLHWQARIQLARAEKRLNHPDQVIEALTPLAAAIHKGAAGSSDYADALPMLGEALLSVGQVGEAESVLTQALQSLPATADRRPTWMKIAELRAVQGHWTEMFQALDELAKLDTDSKLLAQSAYDNADRAIAKKEWATAQKLLERVVGLGESSPQYVTALSDLGTVQAQQGQHAQAAESYRKLLSSTTTDPEVLSTASFNLGFCLEQDAQDDPTKLAAAAAALSQGAQRFAIPKEKKLPDAIEQKVALQASKCARRAAAIDIKLKQIDEADKLWQLTYDQIEKLQPADQERERGDDLLFVWAGNQLNAGNPSRADELFTKLYETYPTSEFADDARLYVAQGHDQAKPVRINEARKLYQWLEADATAAPQTKQDALLSWMNLEARVENWAESQRIAEVMIKSFASSPVAFEARFRLGEAQVQRGDYPSGAQTLTALRSDPALPAIAWRPQLELLWAESQIGLKEYAAVRTALASFIASQPDPVLADQAHEILGRADLREARFDEARVHLEVVTNSPASAKTVLAAKAQLAIADSYLTQIKYDKAIPAYNKVYVNYDLPEFQAPALLQMAACDMAMKQWGNAKMTLDTLIKEFPQSPQAKTAAEDLKVVLTHLPATSTP